MSGKTRVAGTAVTRRDFLKFLGVLGASLAGGSALASCAPSTPAPATTGAAKPIKIGAMYILSGGFATYGEFAREGVNMAISEINAEGGLLGREVTAIFEHEGGPTDQTIRTARRLVLEEKVDFLVGIDSSGRAEALVPVMPELQRILMLTHAATPRATGDLCNRYVFRCSVNLAQNAKAAALIAKDMPYRRWATVGPDYAFGHQSWEYFSRYLKELKPDVEIMEDAFFPKLGAEDFTPFITAMQDAKPDALWVSEWGNDLVNFIRQGNQFGLFEQIPTFMALGAAMEVLEALKDEMPLGVWVGTRYWFLTPETEINRTFVQNFHDRYGHYPSYNAQNGYVGVKLLAEAIKKAGTTDTDAVIQALEGLEYEASMGHVRIRPEDHQAVVNVTWGQTAASDEYPFRILDPIRVLKAEEVTPPVEETGCKMA